MDPHGPKRKNLYWYANGNPLNVLDPSGMDDLGGVEAGAEGSGFSVPEITIIANWQYVQRISSGVNALSIGGSTDNGWSFGLGPPAGDFLNSTVATTFPGDLLSAVSYIEESPTGVALMSSIANLANTNAGNTAIIQTGSSDDNAAYSTADGWPQNVVIWAPRSRAGFAYSADGGPPQSGRISPAVLLAHELGHLIAPLLGSAADTEQGVTSLFEYPIASDLADLGWNETPRRVYGLTAAYPTSDPTATSP